MTGADLESAVLDNADLSNAVLVGAQVGPKLSRRHCLPMFSSALRKVLRLRRLGSTAPAHHHSACRSAGGCGGHMLAGKAVAWGRHVVSGLVIQQWGACRGFRGCFGIVSSDGGKGCTERSV